MGYLKFLEKRDRINFLKCKPFAHRGLHDCGADLDEQIPENSIRSFELAIKNGFSIEMDLQVTGDLDVVVFHDSRLERLTNKVGLITEKSNEYLKTAYLSNNENIPSLKKVLEYVNGKVPIILEVKSSKTLKENKENFCKSLLKNIACYNGEIGLMSFDTEIIKLLKKTELNKKVFFGLTTDFPTNENKNEKAENNKIQKQLMDMDLDFISQNWKGLKSKRINDIRASGLVIICWTVRSQKVESSLKFLADNITFEGYKPL